MKNPLLPLLSALLLTACNLVVTTPAQPQLSVAVPALEGRWHNLEQDGSPSADEYLDVRQVGDSNHYSVVLYEQGQQEDAYRILLCPTGKMDSYWGFVRDEDINAGYLLFHIVVLEREVEFRWLDDEKAEALLASAGLPFEVDRDPRMARFSTLKIHASWNELVEALNTAGVDVLDSGTILFRRGTGDGDGNVPERTDPRSTLPGS